MTDNTRTKRLTRIGLAVAALAAVVAGGLGVHVQDGAAQPLAGGKTCSRCR
jgi:hypothetical protein